MSSIAYNLCYYGVIRVIFYTVAPRVHNVLVLPFKNRRELWWILDRKQAGMRRKDLQESFVFTLLGTMSIVNITPQFSVDFFLPKQSLTDFTFCILLLRLTGVVLQFCIKKTAK